MSTISNELKIPKEEVWLDPSIVSTACGLTGTPLLLNDLYVEITRDGVTEYIKAIDWILQEKIEIARNGDPIINNQTVTIKWLGTNDVKIYIDDSQLGIDPSGDREHTQAFTAGPHTVLIQSIRDRRGLTYEFDIAEASDLKVVSIKYGEDDGANQNNDNLVR
jgi:hypothetical protein